MAQLNILALAGGVGGAKLAAGLQAALEPGRLTVLVNTGDDFEHWGLNICPDLDTVMYNLAGVNNSEQGWGRVGETFGALEAVSHLGGEDWFRLGDKDLAVHLRRSDWLRQGVPLTDVTDRLRRALGVRSVILPMADSPVRTLVHTDEGDLPFQHYFVRRRCEPIVMDLTYVGAEQARINPTIEAAVASADLIVLCPSNPYLSIDPILSVQGIRRRLYESRAPKLAVSPIIGGQAVKGPAAKMIHEMGLEISPLTIAKHYGGLLDGFVVDERDAMLSDNFDLPILVTQTLMTDLPSKERLATEVIEFGLRLIGSQVSPTPAPTPTPAS
jgi:LPPG:FO 2-phospho-L-lactate transferase